MYRLVVKVVNEYKQDAKGSIKNTIEEKTKIMQQQNTTTKQPKVHKIYTEAFYLTNYKCL